VSQLQRLVLDYRSGELVLRVLYRSEDGSNPGAKARAREVFSLVHEGLHQSLASLGGVWMSWALRATRRGRILCVLA